MTETEFDSLFGTFCTDMYENTKQFMVEEGISDSELFSIHDVGHYKAFEKIIQNNFEILKDLLETNQYHAALLSRIESKIDNNLWCPLLKKEVN